jgi:hypothetical protein
MGATRARGDQSGAGAGAAGDAVEAGGVEGFGRGQRRHDGGGPARQRRPPRPRWPQKAQILGGTPQHSTVCCWRSKGRHRILAASDTPASRRPRERPLPLAAWPEHLARGSERRTPMRPFLEEMELHLMVRRLRRMGVESLVDETGHYTRTRLQHSPPFAQCPAGFIRDLHEGLRDGPTVACPRMEALLECLVDIF